MLPVDVQIELVAAHSGHPRMAEIHHLLRELCCLVHRAIRSICTLYRKIRQRLDLTLELVLGQRTHRSGIRCSVAYVGTNLINHSFIKIANIVEEIDFRVQTARSQQCQNEI